LSPEDFVKGMRKTLLDDNMAIYKDLFANTDRNAVSDPYWKKALSLYDVVSEEQKDILFQIKVNLEMNYHQEDKEVFPSKSGNHLVVCGSR
jgi:hypothetical protein